MFKFVRNKIGMTLIEVLTAVFILSIVVVPLTGYFLTSNNRARKTLMQRRALAVAERYVETLRQERFQDIFFIQASGEVLPVDYDVDGRFTVYTTYDFVEVVDGSDRFITKVTVTVEWPGGEVSITTLASPTR